MTWSSRYRIRSYLGSSLWIVPIGAIVLEQIFAAFIHALDARYQFPVLGYGGEGAKVIASTVTTFALSFVVFTFGSLLFAVQVASGQYTPRIIATTLLRDNVIRFTVGLFVFALLFAVKTLNSIETVVPQLAVIFRSPGWDDFVQLAFTEIRFCGANNIQIARRLRAMIVNLTNSLPAERHPALRREADLLDRTLEKLYLLPEDLALARIERDYDLVTNLYRRMTTNWR